MDRTFKTLLLAVLGLAVFGLLRPDSSDPLENDRADETRFFIRKAHESSLHDGVVIGDSRALHAVSPAILAEGLDGLDVYNFAFNSGGLNDEMFAAAEALLDPASARRTVLVAVTPLALQDWKVGNLQYHEFLHKSFDQVMFYEHMSGLARFFRPYSPSWPIRWALGIKPRFPEWHTYHDDGWIETRAAPMNFASHWAVIRRRLEGNTVSDELVRSLLDRVAAWTDAGIRVVGFIPPTTPESMKLEVDLLGFDADTFRLGFAAAGAEWRDFGIDDYKTYDGSHLDADSARRFSRVLASSLAAGRPADGAAELDDGAEKPAGDSESP